jgi:DNA-binding CsgD family transcriptional regulator
MGDNYIDYNLFLQFLETYKGQGFQNINPNDPLNAMIEEKLGSTGQFFHIADVLQMRIVYFSKGCHEFFGVRPEQMDPSVYMENTHPDDFLRHSVGRSKLIKLGSELYTKKQGKIILSTNLKTLNASNIYIDLLYQLCVCYLDIPHPAVYSLQINTDISGIFKSRYGYHYYVGDDISQFRYPDKELLKTGNIFSKREFEIIKGIAEGLDSKQIADKLFLSVHTINTHRRNILDKTNHRSTHELIIELQERGVI